MDGNKLSCLDANYGSGYCQRQIFVQHRRVMATYISKADFIRSRIFRLSFCFLAVFHFACSGGTTTSGSGETSDDVRSDALTSEPLPDIPHETAGQDVKGPEASAPDLGHPEGSEPEPDTSEAEDPLEVNGEDASGQEVEPCVPACEAKECGGDGCQGSCGTCEAGYACEAGACTLICQPNCEDKECGGDGCGGGCGTCDEHYACEQGACTYQPWCGDGSCNVEYDEDCGSCTADCMCGCGEACTEGTCSFTACDGRVCGPDGCGGFCGECLESQVCVEDGTCACLPQCEGKECGPNGCGDVCGECDAVEVCLSGLCECADGYHVGSDGACYVDGCVPDCEDTFCGPDDCGGSCGECAAEYECEYSEFFDRTRCEDTREDRYPYRCSSANPSAEECGDITSEGCCDEWGRVVWCQDSKLWCSDCPYKDKHCGLANDGVRMECLDLPPSDAPASCALCEPDCEGRDCGMDGCLGYCNGTIEGGQCSLYGDECVSGYCMCARSDREAESCGGDFCCEYRECMGGMCCSSDIEPREAVPLADLGEAYQPRTEDVVATSDGGAIAIMNDPSGGTYYAYSVVKLNAEGETVWRTSIEEADSLNALVALPGGDVVVFGSTYEVMTSEGGWLHLDSQVLAARLDEAGQIVWQTTHQVERGLEVPVEAVLTSDGAIAVAGWADVTTGPTKVWYWNWAMKIRQDGTNAFTEIENCWSNNKVTGIVALEDGGVIVVGYSMSPTETCAFRLTSNGGVVWNAAWAGMGHATKARRVVRSPTGGSLVLVSDTETGDQLLLPMADEEPEFGTVWGSAQGIPDGDNVTVQDIDRVGENLLYSGRRKSGDDAHIRSWMRLDDPEGQTIWEWTGPEFEILRNASVLPTHTAAGVGHFGDDSSDVGIAKFNIGEERIWERVFGAPTDINWGQLVVWGSLNWHAMQVGSAILGDEDGLVRNAAGGSSVSSGILGNDRFSHAAPVEINEYGYAVSLVVVGSIGDAGTRQALVAGFTGSLRREWNDALSVGTEAEFTRVAGRGTSGEWVAVGRSVAANGDRDGLIAWGDSTGLQAGSHRLSGLPDDDEWVQVEGLDDGGWIALGTHTTSTGSVLGLVTIFDSSGEVALSYILEDADACIPRGTLALADGSRLCAGTRQQGLEEDGALWHLGLDGSASLVSNSGLQGEDGYLGILPRYSPPDSWFVWGYRNDESGEKRPWIRAMSPDGLVTWEPDLASPEQWENWIVSVDKDALYKGVYVTAQTEGELQGTNYDIYCNGSKVGANCCGPHQSYGCEDASISACVCAVDPICCIGFWDYECVDLVETLGCGSCELAPIGPVGCGTSFTKEDLLPTYTSVIGGCGDSYGGAALGGEYSFLIDPSLRFFDLVITYPAPLTDAAVIPGVLIFEEGMPATGGVCNHGNFGDYFEFETIDDVRRATKSYSLWEPMERYILALEWENGIEPDWFSVELNCP